MVANLKTIQEQTVKAIVMPTTVIDGWKQSDEKSCWRPSLIKKTTKKKESSVEY